MPSPRHLALASCICLSLAAAGCSKGPQDRLQGTWTGESIDNIPPDQVARANGWVKHTSFDFHGDKVTIAIPAEGPREGTYKVERANGNRMTLLISRGPGEPDSTTLTFTGENSFKWDIGNERTVKFTRKSTVQ
jgi:hypothetical protein